MTRTKLLFLIGLLFSLAPLGCSEQPEPQSPSTEDGAAQQKLVDRAASAVTRMRKNPRFESMEYFITNARAVLVFPRLIKASVIFGGEGGNGVLVARGADGSWSAPAFYSVGAPSVGLQIGYQEATVVLFLMNDAVVERTLRSKLTLGADATVALGQVGERGEAEREVLSDDVYAFSEAGGVYAGISLDGYVIGTRAKHNQAYYGPDAQPHAIVLDRKFDRPGAAVLRDALRPKTAPSVATKPAPAEPTLPAEPALQECSAESRQAEACAEIFQPVCADVDTGVRCIKAPCPESREQKTFANACKACMEAKTLGYRAGECTPAE